MPTPSIASSRHTRALSPTLSSAPSYTIHGQHQKINIVSRLAIEGKIKQGDQGATIRMYLKMTLPTDSVVPGSTIPLFPEENIKILASQVHPIDSNSVPYNFSSTISPLLHHAARALMLPARSPQSYLTLFGLSPVTPTASTSMGSSRYNSSPSSPTNNTPPLDDKYTGHILVSGYNIAFVLPKELPPRSSLGGMPSFDSHTTPTSLKNRRMSVGDKNVVQFMAAVELMVPLASRPPRAPYLLSIPTPRCLSNNVKLRIFPPSTAATSFASLSSGEDESSTWDLTSDPHVTRTSSRSSRTNTYTHFADDESSDSSNAGSPDGCGIQGTFQSAERIRVRWAVPVKSIDLPPGSEGRRKVGVREVKGDMTCVVLGKGRNTSGGAGAGAKDGLIMRIEYKGTCKGVWFPGVATLLGMDVGLVAKNSDVTWVNGMDTTWTVTGGSGYTGWDVPGLPSASAGHASMDATQVFTSEMRPTPSTRHDSNSSTSTTSSLLRAPLPAQNVADYSFEQSTLSQTVSSLGSGPGPRSRAASFSSINGIGTEPHQPDQNPALPVLPITVHINMNDLLAPSKNVFTFSISGVVLLTPKSRLLINGSSISSSALDSDYEDDTEPVALPYFNVLASDAETTVIIVRNDVEASTVEVYNPSGNIRDAHTRKTVLQKGGYTKCGSEGERIALKPFKSPLYETGRTPKTPYRAMSRASSTSSLRQTSSRAGVPGAFTLMTPVSPSRPRRDGPLMIPTVSATVTPLVHGSAGATAPNAHAVRLRFAAPADVESEWLEFGFGGVEEGGEGQEPRVEVACVSLEGVPIRFETTVVAKPAEQESKGNGNANGVLAGLKLGDVETGEKETWVKVHVGDRMGGGMVEVDYVCMEYTEDTAETATRKGKGKGKRKERAQLHVFLPAFLVPVGRLEVQVESISGFELVSFHSDLAHQHMTPIGPRFLHHSVPAYFHPSLTLTFSAPSSTLTHALTTNLPTNLTRLATLVLFLALLTNLGTDLRSMRGSLEGCSTLLGSPEWNEVPDPQTKTVVVTSTVFATGNGQWWFGEKDKSATSDVTPTVSNPVAVTITTTAVATSTPSRENRVISLTAVPEPTSTSTDETQTIVLFQSLPLPWPLRLELTPNTHVMLESVMEQFRKFWQIFRTAYHYPLPPP